MVFDNIVPLGMREVTNRRFRIAEKADPPVDAVVRNGIRRAGLLKHEILEILGIDWCGTIVVDGQGEQVAKPCHSLLPRE